MQCQRDQGSMQDKPICTTSNVGSEKEGLQGRLISIFAQASQYLLSMKATKCCCHCCLKMGKISSAFVLSSFLSWAILSANGFSSAIEGDMLMLAIWLFGQTFGHAQVLKGAIYNKNTYPEVKATRASNAVKFRV